MQLGMETLFAGLAILVGLAFCIWAWWSIPRARVPHAISQRGLQRLEAEEKLRQTIGQFFAGGALLATFALTIYQAFESRKQWHYEYELKARQERMSHFTEAVKAISVEDNPTAHIAGIYALH